MLVTGPRLASAASLHYNRPMHLHRGNLFLVGMPGCGKSTLGRLLAKRLNKPFYDADVELERRLGVSIPLIFELEGEPGFRDREQAVLADLVAETNIVLSTGGGAILRPANRRVQELYALRDALYREVAELVVESDREQVSRLAHRLEQQLRAAARA